VAFQLRERKKQLLQVASLIYTLKFLFILLVGQVFSLHLFTDLIQELFYDYSFQEELADYLHFLSYFDYLSNHDNLILANQFPFSPLRYFSFIFTDYL